MKVSTVFTHNQVCLTWLSSCRIIIKTFLDIHFLLDDSQCHDIITQVSHFICHITFIECSFRDSENVFSEFRISWQSQPVRIVNRWKGLANCKHKDRLQVTLVLKNSFEHCWNESKKSLNIHSRPVMDIKFNLPFPLLSSSRYHFRSGSANLTYDFRPILHPFALLKIR